MVFNLRVNRMKNLGDESNYRKNNPRDKCKWKNSRRNRTDEGKWKSAEKKCW